ncbi:hypothetical protein Afil01_62030 [Actinorhabdospora filicis]|uniref:Uncharacterized protein n=1 Tax=Actinorhabdospora filicis TaxID=1785913 RepID=A0A9W6WD98_9ACTN|nr:hypothetical protein [Actinorhabdospora filicis]GLZ81396.1 hypothetical protein Afil01_62030 [Actinorhabdospora filicis]
MDFWEIVWLAWFGIFGVLEGVALARKEKNDTLSEHIWKWFAIGTPGDRPRKSGWVQLRRVGLVAGLAWLCLHFLTGGWV